jgi:hypothetical protein
MLYAGIDWADDHHDLVVIDDAGRTLGSLRVSHDPAGLTQLHEFLAKFAPEQAEMACVALHHSRSAHHYPSAPGRGLNNLSGQSQNRRPSPQCR